MGSPDRALSDRLGSSDQRRVCPRGASGMAELCHLGFCALCVPRRRCAQGGERSGRVLRRGSTAARRRGRGRPSLSHSSCAYELVQPPPARPCLGGKHRPWEETRLCWTLAEGRLRVGGTAARMAPDCRCGDPGQLGAQGGALWGPRKSGLRELCWRGGARGRRDTMGRRARWGPGREDAGECS